MSEQTPRQAYGRVAKMLETLRRRQKFLEERTQGGQIKGYDNEERRALAWVLDVLRQKCSCEEDESEPCFHCATHGVVAARRLVDRMGANQAAAIRYLQDRGEAASAEAIRDILHPGPAARGGA